MIKNDSYQEQDWVDDPGFQDWLNDLAVNAPECCWDADEAMTEIVRRYVRHLEAEVKRLGGSRHQLGFHDPGECWCITAEDLGVPPEVAAPSVIAQRHPECPTHGGS